MNILFHSNALNLEKTYREEYMMLKGFSKAFEKLDVNIFTPHEFFSGSKKIDWVFSYKSPKISGKRYLTKDTKFAFFYPDVSDEPDQKLIEMLKDYDLLLVTDKGSIPQFEEALPDITVRQFRQGVEPSFYRSVFPYNPNNNPLWNWIFAGSIYRGREEFANRIAKVPRGAIFGNRWEKLSNPPVQWKGIDIYNEELAMRICKSILTLNYNVYSYLDEAFSVRVYKTMSSGGVLFTNPMKGFDNLFEEGVHYLKYDDYDEMTTILRDPLEYYDADKLMQISKNAQLEVNENHTYEKRGAELCKLLQSNMNQ